MDMRVCIHRLVIFLFQCFRSVNDYRDYRKAKKNVRDLLVRILNSYVRYRVCIDTFQRIRSSEKSSDRTPLGRYTI